MENKTRVVVYGSSLNMAGLAASLKAYSNLDVVCVNPHSPTARASLDEISPAAIAFDLNDTTSGLDIRLLRERPGLLLVGVDPSSDHMLVLSSHPARALSSVDLINVFCHEDSN